MKQSTCNVGDCENPVGPRGAKGMCPYHYRRSRPPCTVDGCAKVQAANGYCSMHNYRWKSTGNPHETQSGRKNRPAEAQCAVEGCGQPQRKRTWCASHYSQWVREGDVRPFRYKWAEPGTPCKVCGGSTQGRRSYCGQACRVAAGRVREPAFCVLCQKEISLGRRQSDGRLQRTDTVWCRDCGRVSPDAMRFKIYGVTPDEYRDALARGCEICGEVSDRLHVDHDHRCCSSSYKTCGKCVRGFLCGACNRALGMMKDDADRLVSAIKYLRRSSR